MEELRKKKHLPVLRVLFYTAFVFILLWFFQSDFFIARIALPFTANYYGMTLTVSNAGYHFFNNKMLFADDLMLMDDQGNELTVKRAELHLSLFGLLRGKYQINDATLRGIHLNIRNPIPETGNMTIPDPAGFHIGPVHMSNIMITHGKWRLHIRDFQSSGALANMHNVLHCNGTLSSSMRHKLPVKLSLQWNRTATQWLSSFNGTLELLPGQGKLFQRDLADFHFRLLFSGKATKKNLIHWRTFVESEGIGPTKNVLCRTNGYFDPATLTGSFRNELTGHFSEAELRKGAGIFLGDGEVPVPENLKFQTFVCNGKFDRNSFHWDCNFTAAIDRLWFKGKEYLSSTKLEFSNTGSFEFSEPQIRIKKLNMKLLNAQASLTMKNKDDFIFHYDDSGWHVTANNSQLQMNINQLPAALLNVWLPMEITSGIINGQYIMTADSKLQKLKGSFRLDGNDIALSLSNKPFIEPLTAALRMDLESNGLEQIKSLAVKRCTIDIDNRKNEKILHADLGGIWYFKKSRIDLNGALKIFTYPATAAVHDPFTREIHNYLKKHHYENITNHSKINMSLLLNPDVEQNQLKLQLDTSFNSFVFLGKKYKDYPLNLSVKAESSFSSSAMNIHFPVIRLYLKNLTDISGSGNCSFPAGEAQFKVDLNRFSPELWNSLAKAAECELDHLQYRSLTGSVSFHLSAKDETLRLQKGAFTFIPCDNASIRLNLDREVFSLWKNLKDTDIPMTVTVKDLPLSWWNCWLPYDTTFRFRSGMGYAVAEVTGKNLCRDFYLNIDGGVKGASFGVDDLVWNAGDCTVKGRAAFPDYFRDVEFHSIRLAALDQGKEYISFLTNGFAGINTDRETSMQFTITKTTPLFLYRLCNGSESIPELNQFDLTGKFTYDGDASYDDNRFTWDIKVNELAFKESKPGTLPPLNGHAAMKLQVLPKSFSFRDAKILLQDNKQQTRFDLGANLTGRTGNNTPHVKYHVQSNTLDLQYLMRLFSGNAEKLENIGANILPASAHGKNKENSALYSFVRKFRNTGFSVDLNHIMFTEHLNMTLKGGASFTEHGIKTDTIRWNINQKGETDFFANLDVQENGYTSYNGNFYLKNISLVPFLNAFSAYSNKKIDAIDGLKGEICESSLEFSGSGLSKKALKENLQIKLQAQLKDLSIPPAAKDVSIVIKILLFPLEQVPALINKIKYEPAKVILQNVMGEHINVVTGKQSLEFKEGHVRLSGTKDHFTVEKMLFRGPSLRFRVLNGYLQPFRNKMFLDTQIRIGTMHYPLVFDCPLDNPDYNLNTTLQRWLAIPTQIIPEKK